VIESPAPLMLAWGEESDVVTAEGVARLLDIAPRTQIVQIPGVRHSAATEDNDAFVNMVSGFVDRIAVPRSD
jgi:pimeloyl-ACP methyl ester carboxylesterase